MSVLAGTSRDFGARMAREAPPETYYGHVMVGPFWAAYLLTAFRWKRTAGLPATRRGGTREVFVFLTRLDDASDQIAVDGDTALKFGHITRAEHSSLNTVGPELLEAETRWMENARAEGRRVDAKEAASRPGLVDDLAESAGNVAGTLLNGVAQVAGGAAKVAGGALGESLMALLRTAGPVVVIGALGVGAVVVWKLT